MVGLLPLTTLPLWLVPAVTLAFVAVPDRVVVPKDHCAE